MACHRTGCRAVQRGNMFRWCSCDNIVCTHPEWCRTCNSAVLASHNTECTCHCDIGHVPDTSYHRPLAVILDIRLVHPYIVPLVRTLHIVLRDTWRPPSWIGSSDNTANSCHCTRLLGFVAIYSFYRNTRHYLPYPRDQHHIVRRLLHANYHKTILPVRRNIVPISLATLCGSTAMSTARTFCCWHRSHWPNMCTWENCRLAMHLANIRVCRDHVRSPNCDRTHEPWLNRLRALSPAGRNDCVSCSNPNSNTMCNRSWNIRACKCHRRNCDVAIRRTPVPECHLRTSNRWTDGPNKSLCDCIRVRRPAIIIERQYRLGDVKLNSL